MQRIDGKTVYAATDLVKFLACRHATALDQINLETPLQKAVDDESAKLIQRLGHEHEAGYLQKLRSQPRVAVCEIPAAGTITERCSLTRAAMERGDDVIYQAAFFDGTWLGYADFLRKVAIDTRLGPWGYEAVDTKLARSEKPEYAIQLSMYSHQIAGIQGVAPSFMHVVLGDGREVPLRVSDFQYYFGRAKRRFEQFVTSARKDTSPEPCAHCNYCSWRDLCGEAWEAADHLSLVANITKNQIKKLRTNGIDTLAQLAKVPAATRIPKMPEELLSKLRSQAQLHLRARETGERCFEFVSADAGRGFSRLPKPDAGDIFFDIEGDPLYPDKLEYLFGCYFREGKKDRFRPFWAHDHDAEKNAVKQLLTFFTDHLSEHSDARIYHYAAYEVSALKRLTAKYAVGEFELDQLLRDQRFVDLYKVVREALRVSEPNYSIKSIEKFYMPARETDVATGADSIVAYERYRETKDDAELQAIWAYNQDDLKSTRLLQEWLLSIRPAAATWFTSESAGVDQEKLAQHAVVEAERQKFEARLVGRANTKDPLRSLTADLIDFHRRADKPVWWGIFDRADWDTEELIEDPESIGGLTAHPKTNPVPVARSLLYTFHFPKQDTKLGVGDQCRIAATSEYAGTIDALNEDDGVIVLKRNKNSDPFPRALSIVNGGPLDNKNAVAAIKRFAESLIAGSHRYQAVEALIARQLPVIKTRKPGQAIVSPDKDLISEAAVAIGSLDNSCLFVQGPPGSGKTTTSAAVIVELLKQGRSVGVAANSHKAINNLLAKIEGAAEKIGFSFKGAKKSTEKSPESLLKGRIIKDVFNYPEPGAFQLVAGTSWLFSREEYDQSFDYLFIDEAGQVALANVVAMGLSAHNLVLVGDQMQLGQPIQGVHPGESGLSVLDYLLRSQSTIPPDRGIFLPITWRLNPNICKFISDAVYDSRLKSHPRTARHRLKLNKNAHSALKAEGIQFVEVDHQGCSQKSEEEGAVIAEIYGSLLKQQFCTEDGASAPMTVDDILVVAPYNVQVNYLKTILPEGARVGTVDKFQGQEAQVVIVSMTTSSADDMPRNLEFLLSKNRLNVAVSRARTLTIVVASPSLLEVPCTSIEQMRLANTLCWANAVAMSLETLN